MWRTWTVKFTQYKYKVDKGSLAKHDWRNWSVRGEFEGSLKCYQFGDEKVDAGAGSCVAQAISRTIWVFWPWCKSKSQSNKEWWWSEGLVSGDGHTGGGAGAEEAIKNNGGLKSLALVQKQKQKQSNREWWWSEGLVSVNPHRPPATQTKESQHNLWAKVKKSVKSKVVTF